MSDRYGLGSSHYSWSSGMDASFLDPLLIKPHTSWTGTRGTRMSFGADTGEDDFRFDDIDDGMEDELDLDEEYGRLYVGAKYHELDHAEPGDIGALIGRSGSSGYRGGRPSFGLADVHTPLGSITNIDETAAFFLGCGALIVFGKAYGAW